ncbi:hypothetical protein [Occultella glacieicola]|uniref:hypothetical protein n=1 Tax=Occultella glacieicola TaxID=2518684 RepID=UPI0014055292|nr:hypothetical protein [Occultella glacieicola]
MSRRPTRRPTTPRAPFGERVLDGTRTVAMLAAVSAIVLVLAVPVLTLLPGLAAGSQVLAGHLAGRRVRPLRDTLALVVRTTPVTWPVSVAVALGLAAVGANLIFLAQQATVLAAYLLAVNLAVVALGGCWTAACARELADDPGRTRRELLRAGTTRAVHVGRWHAALALGAVLAVALVLVSPLVAAFFAPGLALLLGRLADPRPIPALREVTP